MSVTGIDSGDTAWILASAALVNLMTPGLSFFYAGLVNSRNVIGTLMLSYGTMGIITILWSLIGYSIAFGPTLSSEVVGDTTHATLSNMNEVRVGTKVPELAFAFYQLMFAIVTAAIISGSVAQRIRFIPFMAFVALWHLLVYCPLAHWVFAEDGWINKYGAIDFAGGLVVHVASGFSAFVAAYWLGRSPVDDDKKPHNIPYVLLGAALLWFGWFGFNAGSALAANQIAALALTNTQIGAATAMLTWSICEVIFAKNGFFQGHPTAVGAALGCVVGLVTMTPCCAYVKPMWGIFIAAFTSTTIFFSLRMIKKLPIDDTLDVFAVHGFGGAIGSLMAGLFATTSANPMGPEGAFYGNGKQFGNQVVALLAAIALCTIMTSLIMLFLKGVAKLLGKDMIISVQDAIRGIDASHHGESAYNVAVAVSQLIARRSATSLPSSFEMQSMQQPPSSPRP